jgi:membrane protease YdiL (CAAX protease family)
MTATNPPPAAAAGPPAARPQPTVPAAATGGVGDAALLVGTRIALWVGVQLLLAGLLLLGGAAAFGQALNQAAGWWMVYMAFIDLGTLGVIGWLLGRDGRSYRSLLGPPTTAWQIGLGAVGVLAASVPAVVFSGELTSARYGQGAIAPMFAVVDLPPWASVVSVLVVPLLAELAEPVAYLGVVLPRLERRLGRAWLAATIVVVVWAGEHAFFPLLTSDGGLDWGFAAYRVGSVLPFLAVWTALYYALGRRLLPIMAARWVFNGGTALALALGLVE